MNLVKFGNIFSSCGFVLPIVNILGGIFIGGMTFGVYYLFLQNKKNFYAEVIAYTIITVGLLVIFGGNLFVLSKVMDSSITLAGIVKASVIFGVCASALGFLFNKARKVIFNEKGECNDIKVQTFKDKMFAMGMKLALWSVFISIVTNIGKELLYFKILV